MGNPWQRVYLLALLVTLVSPAAAGRESEATLAELSRWHEIKARGGPTFSGSPAWRAHVEWVESELKARGVRGILRDEFRYPRWWTDDSRESGAWTLAIEGEQVPVASYWAYSGSTPDAGISAPLALHEAGLSATELAGRILVFEVPQLGSPPPPPFAPPGHEYATADVANADRGTTTDHWYQVNWATRFGGLGEKLRKAKAAAGIVLFDMGPGRADGIYTFPLLVPGEIGVPGTYLDRRAGARVRAAALAGQSATVTLRAQRAETSTWFLSGVLPGPRYGRPDDEFVLLITHTDGPNLSQENGALGILAIVDRLSAISQRARQRSVLILLDPQHYMPGRHLVDWFDRHPDFTRRIVASIGVEQLGQREYVEQGDEFVQSGRPEISVLLAQDNPLLIREAVRQIESHRLPRTELRIPAREGQGRWFGLGEVAAEKEWPGYGFNTDMSAYWSTRPGLESFDPDLATRQVQVLTDLTRFLLRADRKAIQPAPPFRRTDPMR